MASGNDAACNPAIIRLGAGTTTPHQYRGSRVGRSISLLLAWVDRSRQRHELDELDDRLLRDIGVTRDEARREAIKPFWQNGAGC
jgi:uncharacterized protein YjiS (DUF1127 family)